MFRDLRTPLWTLALATLAIALAFVPLFDLIGYEFSFVMAFAASFAGAHLGAAAAADIRTNGSTSDRAALDARPIAELFSLWVRKSLSLVLMLLVPLAIMALNALRVRNCNFFGGLAWYFLLPILSAICATGWALAAGFSLRRGGTALAILVVFASFAWSIYRLYRDPPIFAYDPFAGYFPGSLYDEEVVPTEVLYWARTYHLLCAATALSLAGLFLDGTSVRASLRSAHGRAGAAISFLILGSLSLSLYHERAERGFIRDAAALRSALGGHRTTEHFELYYTPTGPFAKKLDEVASDHEFRYLQLKATFGVEPAGKVESYLFDSPAQKRSLMGADRTSITRPYLRQIYLQSEGLPHPVLKHELGHVFAGAFGDSLLGISLQDLYPNVGLIEGVAVAGDFSEKPLTPHQAVAAMRQKGQLTSIERLFSPRFFGVSAGQAYLEAGSFCRFLLDTYGAPPLEKVFRAGGSEASFSSAYGISLSALEQKWLAFIDTQSVPPEEGQVVREHLRAPSLFKKPCAHELALRKAAAQKAAGAQEWDRALVMLKSVCHDDPAEPQHQVAIMDMAWQANRPQVARDEAQKLIDSDAVSAVLKGRAYLLLGDIALTRGETSQAIGAYDRALALPLDEPSRRLATAKRFAAAYAPGNARDLLVKYLIERNREPAVELLLLRKLADEVPNLGLAHYLFGRRLVDREEFADGIRELAASRRLGLPDDRFDKEALRLSATSLYKLKRYDDARAAFAELSRHGSEAERAEAKDFIARTRFEERGAL